MATTQSREREAEARNSETSDALNAMSPETRAKFGTNLAAIPGFPSIAASPAFPPSGSETATGGRPNTASSVLSSHVGDQHAFQHIFPAQSDVYNLDSRGPEGAPDTMMLPQFWAEVVSVTARAKMARSQADQLSICAVWHPVQPRDQCYQPSAADDVRVLVGASVI